MKTVFDGDVAGRGANVNHGRTAMKKCGTYCN